MGRFSHRTVIVILLILNQAVGAPLIEEETSRFWSEAQQKCSDSLKQVFVNFWDTEFRNYHQHDTVRGLIGQIDDQEMLTFLSVKGIKIDPSSLVTSDNLIAYLRYKHLGTEATYAWIDLLKGNPDFIHAVLDWQVIQKDYGFEFVPTYYLLFKAKLTTKKDREAWSDIFKFTFDGLQEQDEDKKKLLLVCLMPRIWGDLGSIEPPTSDRFAFLAEELNAQEEVSSPYAQALVFNLYGANFISHQYKQAADFGKMFAPIKIALDFRFIAQTAGNDLPAAKATLLKMESLPHRDEEGIRTGWELIKMMTEQSNQSSEFVLKTPSD